MEVTLNLGFRQIVNLLNQLPANQIAKIKNEFSDYYLTEKARSEVSDFQKFILSGPLMSDEQYSNFCLNRQQFSVWRTH